MDASKIMDARRKFLGSRLWRNLEDVEDEVDVRIVIDVENGHTLDLTLGDLRALKQDLEQNDAAKLRRALVDLVDAVAGEQEDEEELERALGKAAVPALEYARSLLGD